MAIRKMLQVTFLMDQDNNEFTLDVMKDILNDSRGVGAYVSFLPESVKVEEVEVEDNGKKRR